MHRQLMEAYGKGIMEVQHIRKWCRYFGAGRPDIRDNRNGRPSAYRTNVNGEQVGELILENRQIPIPDLSAASEKYTTSFKNNFDIAKVHARWLSRRLTEENKNRRFEVLLFHIFNG